MRVMGRSDRRRLALLVALSAVLASVACSDPPPPEGERSIRIASFDFVESQVLGAVYAAALERRGYDVVHLKGLSPREVLAPALQQGLVDLVPEYAGSALRFFGDPAADPAGLPLDPVPALRTTLADRRLAVLEPAPGEDQNGVVVTRSTAISYGLTAVSDLAPAAPELTFGGPPECDERPLCLAGLRERYGLRFQAFLPFPSRSATAEALLSRQLDVGMLETVDAHLADGRLVLLDDDRSLQPAENVVPVLRQELLDRHGPALVGLLDRVSASLTTASMTALNREVVLRGSPVEQAAAIWVQQNVFGATP
jgi:osmoprotectant transport system substrate-binding protein